jgi:hypothetical protein
VKITDDLVDEVNRKIWSEAKSKHGTASKVPRDEQSRMGELIRGLYVMQVWQNTPNPGNVLRFMKEYSISTEVSEYLIGEYLGKQHLVKAEKEKKPEKRANKWKALEEWAKANTYAEVTTEQMVSLSGFSYSTVLNYVKTSPYFRKISRGVWEVRDPKEDREREKNG